ncbi:hypothetical protein BLNAU_8038 [Blattamonas nauphoetae]|uniref:Protein kinase domain-containing protein n=1 Tax=Blattamonas nauphoetae TaxID=2049346 RepID=A0ABQ9XZS4_9EUKA|nr:hypothetical protein BLNAU_8038 [Blattamonas nauphoetae]
MNGKHSTICPSSTPNLNEDLSDHSESNGFADARKNRQNELFRISNSTIWMSELTFECGSAGSSIATVSGSYVMIGKSHVISNSERTPLVIIGGDAGKFSSITIYESSHSSSCFPSLLPLTSLESRSLSSASPSDVDVAQNVEIASHGLWIRDASLIVGTGPLFDFCGLSRTNSDCCSIITTLSSASLLNTTSNCGDVKEGDWDVKNCWTVSQKMIGSCVSSCTNHLYGTAIHDLNLGGSVLCSNTSFTHCTASDYYNQHKTTRTELTAPNVIHHFSLCTFKGCTASTYGGAIAMYNVDAGLEIESCSFDSCSSSNGGSVFFQSQTGINKHLTISSSSFVTSSSSAPGGSLSISGIATITISDSVFLNSQANSLGGAVYINAWDVQSPSDVLSNCLFENSRTTAAILEGGGGGCYFSQCYSIRLDSLRFRGCSSFSGNGRDLYFYKHSSQTYPLPTVSLSTVFNCDSTSTPEENRFYPTTLTTDPILPTPTQTATIQSLTAQLTSSTEAEISVTLNKAVSGRLLLLVSNARGTPRTDSTKAPNIDRVLAFTMSSSVGKTTVSIDDTGLLQQSLEDYRISAATLSDHNVSFSDSPIVIVTLTPTLTSAECVLDESHTKAVLNLEGSDVDGETFVFTLHDKSTIKGTFSGNEARVDLGLIGANSKWKENMTFVIVSGMKEDDGSIVVSMQSPVFFTIPEAACLSNIEVSDLNEAKTEIKLSFSSRHLKGNSDYEIRIQERDGIVEFVMNLTTDSAGHLADETVKLYLSNENEEEWKNWIEFGKDYEVIGVSASIGDVDYPTQFSPILLRMPMEPVRVKDAGCSTDQPMTTVVWISGSGLIQDETSTLTLSGTPTTEPTSSDIHTPTITVKASSQTAAQSSVLSLSSSSDSSLCFGFTYEITAITNGTEAGVVEGGEFKTPSEPSVTLISCKLKDGDAKTVEISISGLNIADGEYWLVLKGTVSTKETELKIRIANSEGTLEFVIFSSSTLEYGATYEVLSLSSSSLRVALPKDETKRSLTMPGKPARVSSVSCELSGELKTHAKIVICGAKLPSGKTLSVKVKKVDTAGLMIGSEIELPETEVASETRTKPIEIEVYKVSELLLEYGKTSELVSLAISDTASFILDESVRFSMPIEPVRVTSASHTQDGTDRIVVTVGGSGFVSGEFYTVTVSGSPINSPSPPPSPLHEASFVVTASSEQLAKSSSLQLYHAEGSDLKFSYSYTIVGISYGSVKGVIHSGEFNTPDDANQDDALITRIEVVLASSLNTSMMIEVSGSNLPSGTIGTMTLHDSFTFNVSFSSDTFGRSEVIPLGVNDSLAFGSEYEITALENSNKQPIQTTKTTIATPRKPSKLSLCVCGTETSANKDRNGADPETCNAIKSAWKTATALGILDTTMRIVDSADLSSPLVVTTSVPFTLLSFQSEPATLQARPSASQPNCVLVSVKEEAECRLTLLTVIAGLSGSSFKLVSASKGTVVIRSCSIEGRGGSGSNNEDGSICGWSRGFVELIETDTELNSVTMKEIEMGGIWMSGGKLNVTAGVFSQNGPLISDFPSARQNIHCEGEGTISIDKQTMDDTDSMWIDAEECSIDGKEYLVASPLYIPTLSSTESTVETDKNGQQTVKVVGKTLMPCGLWLEVFEWDSSKNVEVEGKSELVDLTSTATHWNETEIVIPFSAADVPELNKKMEWRGRLVFGNGERTPNWMVVSELGSGNKSLGGAGSKWWIPVIICLSCALLVSLVIVVCVCMHRKRHSTRKALLMSEEMSAGQVYEDEKMEDNDQITNPPNSALSSLPSSKVMQDTLFENTRFSSGEGIPPSQSCVEVIVCNDALESSVAVETDTLFNALHNAHSTRFVEKRKVSQAIAKGLAGLAEMRMVVDVLTHLSPHWVLFDKNDRVSLRTHSRQSVVLGESGMGEVGKKTSEDGQRWMAPEVGQDGWQQTKENADHGAVFSLGLVLWEIETGAVPFGEVDGAAAQRRLATDEKPRMEKVSESMQAIIVPCLSLDPSQRPTLKTVLSQLDELNSVAEPSNEKEGHAMSHVG